MVVVPRGRNKNIKHRFLDPCRIWLWAVRRPSWASATIRLGMRLGKLFSESPPGQVSYVCLCTHACQC